MPDPLLQIGDSLARMAEALTRLAPLPLAPPPGDAPAYRWDGVALHVADFRPLALDLLTGIDEAKALLVENGRRHARGHAAHDALLWGARGSGKSALVKASIGALRDEDYDLALVELGNDALATLPALFDVLAKGERRVIVFIDDIGFDDGLNGARLLRSVLDGGAAARPGSVRLYVTSNRRHIVDRDIAENQKDEQDPAINVRDVVDDKLALADRFGISLGFHVADQPTYLAMVAAYATAHALPFDPADAVRFATQRGSRSGRVAWHYIVELVGRAGRAL